MNEKDHTERRYTEKEVSETVEKVISEMLARGEIADTRAHNGSSAANVEVPTDALINLVNYQEQCDEDGVMVKVSRQALAEVLVYVQMVRLDLNRNEPQVAAVREALELAEDVLSRAPFSTAIWPNGMHPNRGIEKIRAAIRSRDLPQRSAGNESARQAIGIIIEACCEETTAGYYARKALAALNEPQRPAGNAGVIRLLTKIADLVDDEDAGEPLDDAIRWANEALAILNEPRASADTAHVLNEWADLGSNALQWLKNIKDDISTAEQALEDMQFDYDRVLAMSRAVPQSLPKAILSLVNEIDGIWGGFEPGLRQEIGNTNYNVLQEKLDAALALMRQAPSKPIPEPLHLIDDAGGGP